MRTEPVRIRPLEPGDIEALSELARAIWHAHYPGIITSAQIEYMLEQRYRPELVQAELGRDDVWWELATLQDHPVGFSSCLLTGEPGEMKLDKLYVDPGRQGTGVGTQLMRSVRTRARRLQCRRLILAVNRRNASAIAAYRRWGFRVERAMVTDIGAGFVMDDYLMVVEP
ncbi:MAG: GNAT family N-acetyltransferase [Betaproteobacteria bacterium]|nr:GNAT family N-acetyltransferase [Betaproteobacteria bacterium]